MQHQSTISRSPWSRFLALFLLVVPIWLLNPLGAFAGDAESEQMANRVKGIDDRMEGNLGVYIKDLQSGAEVNYRTDRDWYLASTIKIPLAVAVLQKVEAGELSLTQELEVTRSDYVDGSGALQLAEPGSRYTIEELIQRSTEHSDSTATDMLIRLLGEEEFNRQIQEDMNLKEFGPITTILQVRHDAYAEVHPEAKQLTNLDFMELKKASAYTERYQRFLEEIDIEPEQANASSLTEAFERYYKRGINSGSLDAMGKLLERLVQGELLNEENTDRLLGFMENVNTGDGRIKAGLPETAVFAHKTGTQIGRSCNVGILNPRTPEKAVVVAACAEGYGQLEEAEQSYARLGRLLVENGMVR